MAVDEKYVETVGEEKEEVDFNNVLDEFGVEADFVEDASGITVPADYWERSLKQLPQDEIFVGKPYLGKIETIKWEDKETGEKKVSYQIKLVAVDDESKEAYTIPMNLTNTEVVQENLYPASKLYALQMGLMELKAPGIASQYNRLTVNTDNLRKIVNAMDEIIFKVILVDGGDFTYKSFRIISEDEL